MLRFTSGESESLQNIKVSKYYECDSLQNVPLLVMSLLTAPIVKNNHIID